jgi:glyoxylate utilization-related uncharacterized protein
MFVTLTNARDELKGNLVVLNTDMIVSIFQDTAVDTNKTSVTQKTYVYCPPHGTWEVQETPTEVVALINKG